VTRVRQLVPPRDGEPDLVALYAQPAVYVRGGFVISADGTAVVDGGSRALSGPEDRAVFRTLRAVCDVILVGAATTKVEDYGTVRLTEDGAAWRRAQDLPDLPRVAVVSQRLEIDERVLAGPRPIVITSAAVDTSGLEADVVVAGDDEVDLSLALDLLTGQGLRRILCEGGPLLLGGVIRAGRLTELCLTTSPLLAGAGPGLLPEPLGEPLKLRLEHLLEGDGVVISRYTTVPI
jgi:riboflavin biosynthesis pyrimidine reductase